jgi:hypothetical protein
MQASGCQNGLRQDGREAGKEKPDRHEGKGQMQHEWWPWSLPRCSTRCNWSAGQESVLCATREYRSVVSEQRLVGVPVNRSEHACRV